MVLKKKTIEKDMEVGNPGRGERGYTGRGGEARAKTKQTRTRSSKKKRKPPLWAYKYHKNQNNGCKSYHKNSEAPDYC